VRGSHVEPEGCSFLTGGHKTMLRFKCPHCGKPFRVKEEHAGRKGKCLGCGKIIRIPQAAAIKSKEEPIVAVLVKEERPPAAAPQPQAPPPSPASQSANSGVNLQVSVEGNWGRFASPEERREYLNKARGDPAAQAWRNSLHAYNPIPELSFAPTCPYCGGSLG
jgi:ribosomal protein S27E